MSVAVRILVAILTTALAAGSAAAAGTPTPTRTPLPATPTRTPQAQAAAGSVLRVPADVADLQTAINQIPTGGIIELAAGTYTPPANGFAINDTGRAFTIRAASGATVVLDGGGSRDLVRLINSSVGAGRPVVFESLVFRNGRSTSEGIAGGVTVQRGQVTFRGCTFDSNRSDAPTTGAGGIEVAVGSTAFFFDCTWTGNIAKNYGAGMALEDNSTAYIHNGSFVNNRCNLPNHNPTAAGGGIHVGNSTLRVTNSRFENNQAGYVGGGIYAIGTWTDPVTTPRSDVLVVNSTFVGNQALRDASVSLTFPTEAGALHAEDQTSARIVNSRFFFNSANTGGGVNAYRAIVDISDSHFEGNRATGFGGANGFGGAISMISNDASDASTAGGTINRRPVSLTVRDSLFRGRSGAVTTTAQMGGCIFTAGDGNRVYGQNGVGQNGSVASNRASVTLQRVALVDCDVQQAAGAPGSGVGGGLMTTMTALTLQDSLVSGCDAIGTDNASGGGLALIDQTAATITNTLIAKNTSTNFGGGLFAQGATLAVSGCSLVNNEVSPGVAEAVGNSYGAAIFASPADGANLPVNGTVSNSIISSNVGLPIFDDDRTNGPINDVRYNGNQIYSTTFGSTVYTDSVAGFCCKTTSQLNGLTVTRSNGASTDKSQTDNSLLASAPVVGALLAVPSDILAVNAVGDSAPPTTSYLAYAWSGGSATLDGSAVSGNAGLTPAAGTGGHTLVVGGTSFPTTVGFGAAPAATFDANPTTVNTGQASILSWTTSAGNFLTAAIDQGVGAFTSGNASTSVTPSASTTYSFLDVTDTGGATGSAMVTVNGTAPTINSFTTGSAMVNPGSAALLAWSTAGATSASLSGGAVATSGTKSVSPSASTTYTLNASNSFGTSSASVKVNVNAGSAALSVPTITAPSASQVVSVSGVSFAWNAVNGANGYDLRLFNASSGATMFQGSLTGAASTSTLITLPNGSYLFAVRACSNGFTDARCGRFATRAFAVSTIAPTGAPTVTAPASGAVLTNSFATLAWTAVAGNGPLPVFYEVELTNQATGVPELQITEADPTLSTITKLRSGSYRLRVRACQAGCGPWSAVVGFSAAIAAVPTGAPTVTNAVVSGGNALAVSWTSVSGADFYQLLVIQPPPAGPGGGALTVAAREVVGTSVSALPLPTGGASVIVAACNGNGCGPFSSVSPITAAGPNPNAPQIGQPLGGSVVDGPQVFFSWSRVPGDNGSNTVYRLYVQDLSRQAAALDVLTTQNFYSAYFKAEGTRYDALVIANPGPAQVVGPAVGFNVRGQSSTAPTMTQPTHNSTLPAGNVQLGWSSVPGATLYEYYVAIPGSSSAPTRGVTPGLVVQVPLAAAGGAPTLYSGIVRACPAGAACAPDSDTNWGPWSNAAGPGVTNFTVTP